MKTIAFDQNWTFRWGYLDSVGGLDNDAGVQVNLPHDAMIGTPVTADCPAGCDSGFFNGGICNYTKFLFVPDDWKDQKIGLKFDGAMMNASVDINGCKVAHQNYGYAPFYVDLTPYVAFGQENRITVNLNTGSVSNSRWYTGLGLYRGVQLCRAPKVYIPEDGIYAWTSEVADGFAFVKAQVELANDTGENRVVEVCVELEEDSGAVAASAKTSIYVAANSCEKAYLSINLKNPKLWDSENPNLYTLKARVKSQGEYRTRLEKKEDIPADEAEILFGVRTISADAVRGLLINGKSVKLKGGCLHHDNGLLGAVSLYEVEARKIKKLKELGFNAIRTSHNPPSSALVRACEKLGMYIFDEAFDAWWIGKRAGDYSQYFEANWKKDLTAFIKRDRSSPAVIIWSTGNEIPERAGLAQGYTRATMLATTIKELDASRPVSNGICSLWSGLDDKLAKGQYQAQHV